MHYRCFVCPDPAKRNPARMRGAPDNPAKRDRHGLGQPETGLLQRHYGRPCRLVLIVTSSPAASFGADI